MKAIENFKKFRFLLMELVKKNIKLKYRRSYLGLFWTLLEPILTTIVLTFVFGTLLNRSNDPTYPVYILIGRLSYSFFSTASKTAMRSIRKHSGMIKKVYVPKYIYPLSSVLSNFVIFLLSLIVLVGACLIQGVSFSWYTLQMVFPLMVLIVISLGAGMILSSLSIFFKDLEYLWDVTLMLIMYCSAIFYEVTPGTQLATVIGMNPLYCIILNMRQAVILHEVISVGPLLYSAGFSVVLLGIGMLVFKKTQDKFILHV